MTRRTEFSAKTKVATFERAGKRCENCNVAIYPGNGPEYDHRIACELLGDNLPENCVCLCKTCHKLKTKSDMKNIGRARRVFKRHAGIKKPSRFACARNSKWKKKLDGTVVLR